MGFRRSGPAREEDPVEAISESKEELGAHEREEGIKDLGKKCDRE